MAGVGGTLKLLQSLVVDQWKTGGGAELRVFCENGHLKVNVSADFGPSSQCWSANSASLGGSSSNSRQRRRLRRAAARTAAATERNDAEKSEESAGAGEAAEKVATENAAADKAASVEMVVAANVSAGKDAAKKTLVEMTTAEKVAARSVTTSDDEAADRSAATVASEEVDAEKKAVMEHDSVASTSCHGKQLPEWKSCWTCGGDMSGGHQCETLVDTSGKSTPASTAPCELTALSCRNCEENFAPGHQCGDSTVPPATSFKGAAIMLGKELPTPAAPLPLCLYCCHKGSGLHQVHYYVQCLCSDRVCTAVVSATVMKNSLSTRKCFSPVASVA